MARGARLLRRRFSPDQVAGVLKKRGNLSISHETIYRRIRRDKRTGGDLWRHTRIMSKFGHKRYRRIDSRGVLPGKRSIGLEAARSPEPTKAFQEFIARNEVSAFNRGDRFKKLALLFRSQVERFGLLPQQYSYGLSFRQSFALDHNLPSTTMPVATFMHSMVPRERVVVS